MYADLVPNQPYNSRRAIWHFIEPGLQDHTDNLPPGHVPYSTAEIECSGRDNLPPEKVQAAKLIAKLLSNLTVKFQETSWLFGADAKFRDDGAGAAARSSSVDSRYGGESTAHSGRFGASRAHGT